MRKKLKNNKGFTLVECLVALATLSVLSLVVSMIITNSMKLQESNQKHEEDLGKQVNDLVANNKAENKSNGDITFNFSGASAGSATISYQQQNNGSNKYQVSALAIDGVAKKDINQQVFYGVEGLTSIAINSYSLSGTTHTISFTINDPRTGAAVTDNALYIKMPGGYYPDNFMGTYPAGTVTADKDQIKIALPVSGNPFPTTNYSISFTLKNTVGDNYGVDLIGTGKYFPVAMPMPGTPTTLSPNPIHKGSYR